MTGTMTRLHSSQDSKSRSRYRSSSSTGCDGVAAGSVIEVTRRSHAAVYVPVVRPAPASHSGSRSAQPVMNRAVTQSHCLRYLPDGLPLLVAAGGFFGFAFVLQFTAFLARAASNGNGRNLWL